MPKSGYRQVVPLATKPLEYLGFGLARLAAGKTWTFATGQAEWTVVILSGSVRAFSADGELTRGPLGMRKDVFSGKAAALYLPPGLKGRIEAVTAAELAVCQARVDERNAGCRSQIRLGGQPVARESPLRTQYFQACFLFDLSRIWCIVTCAVAGLAARRSEVGGLAGSARENLLLA